MKPGKPGVRPASRAQRIKLGVSLYVPGRTRGAVRLSEVDVKHQHKLPLTIRDEIAIERQLQEIVSAEGANAMNVRDFTGSRYLTAAELGSERRKAKITDVTSELVGVDKEEKLVLHLEDLKPIVLNKTNIANIANVLGDETDAWVGEIVSIWTEMTSFAGRPVRGLRLAPVAATAAQPQRGRRAGGLRAVDADLDDEIPF